MDLATPLTTALGKPSAVALAGLGLHTVGDLVRHYPRRYVERGVLPPLGELEVGEYVTVLAEVRSAATFTSRAGKRLLKVVVTDGSGQLTCTFFDRASWRAGQLVPGRRGLFAGQVTRFKTELQLTHPVYELGDDIAVFAGALLPVYPASSRITSWNLAKAVATILDVVDVGADPLPAELRAEHALIGLAAALKGIHHPEGWPDLAQARRRLTWDEALVLQVVLAQRRAAAQREPGVPRPGRAGGLLDAFDEATPFTLTAGQREVGGQLAAELAGSIPMYRLLQGEVGSGKTLVALRAMLAVVDSGGQAALLAPTEVLAQQHARSLRALLGPLGRAGELDSAPVATRVGLLTGSAGAASRRTALAEAASGEAGLVVGTHALLSEGVIFADLGLVVIDEQHRFGVEQRDALRAKGAAPHVLVMTATPIPRTVAMTVYGDLAVSTLTELPAGRSPIATHLVPTGDKPLWIDRAWQRVHEAAEAGRQAFVVCPRIGGPDEVGGSDELDGPVKDGPRPAVALLDLLPVLTGGPLAGLRVAGLHGRMPAEEKDRVMLGFARGDIDVLVATTVIEVGVDVPNATVMVVMDADRFGVSQLHQLRGRVGRGSAPGLCLLVTDTWPGSPARDRLEAVAATDDGFALSRIDLEQRREGDVLGAAQSGTHSSLRMLRLLRDEEVILAAREAAVRLVAADPELAGHPALAAAVGDLLDVGQAAFLDKA